MIDKRFILVPFQFQLEIGKFMATMAPPLTEAKLGMLKAGKTVTEVMRYTGVSRTTLYNILKRYED